MQLPFYTLIRFYFWSTGTRNLYMNHCVCLWGYVCTCMVSWNGRYSVKCNSQTLYL